MIWFTADTHFNHTRILQACHRPFKDVDEQNETIINTWNSVVKNGDEVFHLGDFGWPGKKQHQDIGLIISRLNGSIFLIEGNHDREVMGRYRDKFVKVCQTYNLKRECAPVNIFLCHYSMQVWNKSHWNSWHLFGHSHGQLEGVGKSFDVGVDANNFTPISIDEGTKRMKDLPNNINFIEGAK